MPPDNKAREPQLRGSMTPRALEAMRQRKKERNKKQWHLGDIPGGPVLKTSPSNTRCEDLIPDRELRHHSARGKKHKTEAML